MKNNFKKISALFLFSPILLAGIFSLISLASCSYNSTIQFANFESYISNPMQKRLNEKYDITFPNYNTNEDIKIKFPKYYDLAVPSTYMVKELNDDNLLSPINWTKLYLEHPFPDTSKFVEGVQVGDIDNDGMISNAQEALSLFTKTTGLITILTKTYDLNNNGIFGETNDNLLIWGIPYFLQSVMFGYKGQEINNFNIYDITWSDIFEIISSNNSNQDPRFKKIGNMPNLSMVDDSFTLYDIARIVETTPQKPRITPDGNNNIDIFKKTYEALTDYFGVGDFYLNTDSGWLSRSFADPNGYNGLISYNGDIIYAAEGGGEFKKYSKENFHIVKPKNTLYTLDMVVVNKNIQNNPTKEDKIYDVLFDAIFDGYNVGADINKKEDDNFKYGAMLNWNSIKYTPVLDSIVDFVFSNTNDSKEFWEVSTDEDLIFWQNMIKLNIDPATITNFIDQPLTNLQKSNMHWAYLTMKEKI